MRYTTLTNYYNVLFSEAEKEENLGEKLEGIEESVDDESSDNIEDATAADNNDDDFPLDDELDSLYIKEDKDKGDPDLEPISRKDTDTSSINNKTEDLSGMFSDIFESSPDMDTVEDEDDSLDSDLEDEANDMFDMDTIGGDDSDNTDVNLDEDGDSTDKESELDNISDSLDEEDSGSSDDEDIYGDINDVDDNSEVVDNASEIKRANLVKTKLLGLFNVYDQDIKALTDLKLPADKEKIYKPFLNEYKDLLTQLNDYINNFTDKDSSFVMMRTLLMFKFLFGTLDNQTKVITDTIFPDKKGRKK